MAAFTRSGARKASEIVMLTLRRIAGIKVIASIDLKMIQIAGNTTSLDLG
jgi:hypothetical protein